MTSVFDSEYKTDHNPYTGITDTTNYIYFYGIGDGSTAVSKMDYAVNHWINGKSQITSSSQKLFKCKGIA